MQFFYTHKTKKREKRFYNNAPFLFQLFLYICIKLRYGAMLGKMVFNGYNVVKVTTEDSGLYKNKYI